MKMNKKIMIFLEGTIFYTKPVLFLFSKKGYVPTGNAINIISDWYEQGNEIHLCTYAKEKRINFIKSILNYYNIKYTELHYRKGNQTYTDIVETLKPDVLIEDNCKSIGGEKKMCITNVKSEIKNKIISLVVEEFKGIDNLKDKIY